MYISESDLDSKFKAMHEWLADREDADRRESGYVFGDEPLLNVLLGALFGTAVWTICLVFDALEVSAAITAITVCGLIFHARAVGKRRTQVQTQNQSDSLYQRAKLLADARIKFIQHAGRYNALVKGIEKSVISDDHKEMADRYQRFLLEAHHVLEQRIEHWDSVKKLADARDQFLSMHPELLSELDGDSFAEMFRQLNAPLEVPELAALDEPVSAFLLEEAAEEVDIFLDADQLAEQIAELA